MSSTLTSRTHEARAGMAAMIPIVAGLVPFGLVLGTAIAEHASPVAAWSGLLPIFGGSAHLTVIQVLDQGTGALLAIATGLLVHARLAVYSASLAERWRGQPVWFRALAAATLVDPTFVLAEQRASRPGSAAENRHYYLGAAGTLAAAWLVIVTCGVVLGARLNAGLGLDLGIPLCLIALAGPKLIKGDDWVVAAVAGAVAVAAAGLPNGTGLVVAIGAGVGAGVLADGRSR